MLLALGRRRPKRCEGVPRRDVPRPPARRRERPGCRARARPARPCGSPPAVAPPPAVPRRSRHAPGRARRTASACAAVSASTTSRRLRCAAAISSSAAAARVRVRRDDHQSQPPRGRLRRAARSALARARLNCRGEPRPEPPRARSSPSQQAEGRLGRLRQGRRVERLHSPSRARARHARQHLPPQPPDGVDSRRCASDSNVAQTARQRAGGDPARRRRVAREQRQCPQASANQRSVEAPGQQLQVVRRDEERACGDEEKEHRIERHRHGDPDRAGRRPRRCEGDERAVGDLRAQWPSVQLVERVSADSQRQREGQHGERAGPPPTSARAPPPTT